MSLENGSFEEENVVSINNGEKTSVEKEKFFDMIKASLKETPDKIIDAVLWILATERKIFFSNGDGGLGKRVDGVLSGSFLNKGIDLGTYKDPHRLK